MTARPGIQPATRTAGGPAYGDHLADWYPGRTQSRHRSHLGSERVASVVDLHDELAGGRRDPPDEPTGTLRQHVHGVDGRPEGCGRLRRQSGDRRDVRVGHIIASQSARPPSASVHGCTVKGVRRVHLRSLGIGADK